MRIYDSCGSQQFTMSKVGLTVLYQPTSAEWSGYYQHAAIITGWDEQNSVANLIVFPDGSHYSMMKNQVQESTEDGTFQQLGTPSRTAETQKQRKQQAAEIFRQLSGLK